jgi:RNAse (barnase) inhibitor barstar
MNSIYDFYDQITAQMALPDWFGRNLDALNDVFRDNGLGDSETHPMSPVGRRVVWKHHAAARNSLGGKFDTILGIMQRNGIEVVLE